MTIGALENLRVIDATQMLAGPLAGTRLGGLGADVMTGCQAVIGILAAIEIAGLA